MKFLPIYLILSIGLSSCRDIPKGVESITPIDFSLSPTETINLSAFCSSVEYIKLETKSNCYISKISKIEFFGDSIFIFNEMGWNLSEILVFNISGSFIGSFGQIGPGPEEIENPRDVFKSDSSFLIWDRRKVAEFASNGKFKRKLFDASFHGNEIFIDNNKIYLYHGTEFPGMLTQYDLSGSLIDTLRITNPNHSNTAFEGENAIFANHQFQLFAPALDTVWTLQNNSIIPKYLLDFNEDVTLQKFFQENSYDDPVPMISKLNSTRTSNVLRFLENDEYLFLRYIKARKTAYKIINKDSNIQIDFVNCINDLDGGLFSIPISLSNDFLVIPLEPLKIINQVQKTDENSNSQFRKIGKSILENDNPVLMLCRLQLNDKN